MKSNEATVSLADIIENTPNIEGVEPVVAIIANTDPHALNAAKADAHSDEIEAVAEVWSAQNAHANSMSCVKISEEQRLGRAESIKSETFRWFFR